MRTAMQSTTATNAALSHRQWILQTFHRIILGQPFYDTPIASVIYDVLPICLTGRSHRTQPAITLHPW